MPISISDSARAALLALSLGGCANGLSFAPDSPNDTPCAEADCVCEDDEGHDG